MVQCKYERLGDFCFICGLVTHTEHFCRNKIETKDKEVVREWGSWLRAPPRRVMGLEKSRWLREERDEDWSKNFERDNYYQDFSNGQEDGKFQGVNDGIVSRNPVHDKATSSGRSGVQQNFFKIGSSGNKDHLDVSLLQEKQLTYLVETENKELAGLNLEERKRRRGDDVTRDSMALDVGVLAGDITEKFLNPDAGISEMDLSAANNPILAKLAAQASHSS